MASEVTLQRLRYFVRVIRDGSMRRAAEALHLTQPALSAHILALERTLRVPLFERTSQGVIPTPSARQILPRVEELIQAADRLQEYSINLASGQEGVISIACYPVHIERILGNVMGSFRKNHPNVRFDLTHLRDDRRRGGGRSLFDELLAGEVDLAVGPPHLDLGLDGFKLYDARLLALVPDDDPFRHKGHMPIDRLSGKPLLIAPPQFFSREKVEEAAKVSGFSIMVELQSSASSALLVLGRNGLGIPVLPDDYPLVGQQRFPYPVLVDQEGNELLTEVWLQWRARLEPVPAIQVFVNMVRIEAEREAQDGRSKECYYRADLGP